MPLKIKYTGETVSPKPLTIQYVDIDRETGASTEARAYVGAAQTDRDRLKTVRKFYPDATPYGDQNFIFRHPETGKQTLYNPEGFDWRDIASVGDDIASGIGAVGGGAAASIVAPGVGTFAGGLGGAALGREAYRSFFENVGENTTEDTRTYGQAVKDIAGEVAMDAVGDLLFKGAIRGVKAGIGGTRLASAHLRDVLQNTPQPNREALEKVGFNTGRTANPDGPLAPIGAITDNRPIQSIEAYLSKNFTASGVMDKTRASTVDHLNKQLGDVIDVDTVTGSTFGGIMRTNMDEAITKFQGEAERAYNNIYGRINDSVPVKLSATADYITATGRPSDVMEVRNAANGSLSRIISGLLGDTKQIAAHQATPSFAALSRLRTELGRKIGQPMSQIDDINRGELKELYAAVTQDMLQAIEQQGGPELAQQFTHLNKWYGEGINRLKGLEKEIIGKASDPNIHRNLMRGIQGGRAGLEDLRKTLGAENWPLVQDAFINYISRANREMTDEIGEEGFSYTKFVTNWAKTPNESKKALFGDSAHKEKLDQIAEASKIILESGDRFKNYSGTAQAMEAGEFVKGVGAVGIMSWNPATIAPILAAYATPYITAKAMTNRHFVSWFANFLTTGRANMQELGSIAQDLPEIIPLQQSLIRGAEFAAQHATRATARDWAGY